MMPPAVRTIVILAFLGLPVLAACTSPAERQAAAEAQAAADRQECDDLGFEPGTEAFAECLLKLRQIRAEERRAREPSVGVGLGLGFGL